MFGFFLLLYFFSKEMYLNSDYKIFEVTSLPSSESEEVRLGTNKKADYLPLGIFLNRNQKFDFEILNYQQLDNYKLELLIGEPNNFWDQNKDYKEDIFNLKNGINNIIANRAGLVYIRFTKENNLLKDKFIKLKIKNQDFKNISSPLFIKNKTRKDEWVFMLENTQLTKVQILSDRAFITVNKKTFDKIPNTDLQKTSETLDYIIEKYDKMSGLDNSSNIHSSSKLKIHYVEDDMSLDKDYVDNVYMYAADNLIGMKTESVSDLLGMDELKKKWAIWHETGHLYQMKDFTWDDNTEVTVNIFSLYIQKIFGESSRLIDEKDNPDQFWRDLKKYNEITENNPENFWPDLFKYYRENKLNYKKDMTEKEIENFKKSEFEKRIKL